MTVRARAVVVAAGALHTPCLLAASGVRGAHLGAHLCLHPTLMIGARYPQRTHPEAGSPLTGIVASFEDIDGRGHGARIETPAMPLALSLILLPWAGGAQFKRDTLAYPHLANNIIIVRDAGGGRVARDASGRMRIDYVPSAADRASALAGVAGAVRTSYAMGAEKIWGAVVGAAPFERNAGEASEALEAADPAVRDRRFARWLDALRAQGLPNPGTFWGSAHQMSSARMGASSATGVVDAVGRVFGYEALVVADASVLPSAAGVNPMLTVMATAAMISEALVVRLKEELVQELKGRA